MLVTVTGDKGFAFTLPTPSPRATMVMQPDLPGKL